MSEPLFSSSRAFQLWSYTVGHRELLLRSTKDAGLATRVDVLFVNVEAINIPTTMPRIDIVEADERERVARSIVLKKDQKLWLVRGRGYEGHVIGGGMASYEDEKEYNDPSHWHDAERIR